MDQPELDVQTFAPEGHPPPLPRAAPRAAPLESPPPGFWWEGARRRPDPAPGPPRRPRPRPRARSVESARACRVVPEAPHRALTRIDFGIRREKPPKIPEQPIPNTWAPAIQSPARPRRATGSGRTMSSYAAPRAGAGSGAARRTKATPGNPRTCFSVHGARCDMVYRGAAIPRPIRDPRVRWGREKRCYVALFLEQGDGTF